LTGKKGGNPDNIDTSSLRAGDLHVFLSNGRISTSDTAAPDAFFTSPDALI
jgi:hypothetical protein